MQVSFFFHFFCIAFFLGANLHFPPPLLGRAPGRIRVTYTRAGVRNPLDGVLHTSKTGRSAKNEAAQKYEQRGANKSRPVGKQKRTGWQKSAGPLSIKTISIGTQKGFLAQTKNGCTVGL